MNELDKKWGKKPKKFFERLIDQHKCLISGTFVFDCLLIFYNF